ncbi:hypothetical protein [Cribrihabitans neustonicus]|uniref:hypothetical protein n=1 Tax=Cribrihabitans neustonicus TaxID=1429085 RepID=UPI003B5980AF
MKPTAPAQFPARSSVHQRMPGATHRPGQPQPRAVAVALPQAAHPLAAAREMPERLGEAARAALEAVRIFWQHQTAYRRTGAKSRK